LTAHELAAFGAVFFVLVFSEAVLVIVCMQGGILYARFKAYLYAVADRSFPAGLLGGM